MDVHHLAEDCGIALGDAVAQALGDRTGIERYADALVPMDETLAQVVIDLSGRPYLAFEPAGYVGDAQGFNAYHLREFLRGFANHAGATIHVRVLAGEETHHVCEAMVKAFARALHGATRVTHDGSPPPRGCCRRAHRTHRLRGGQSAQRRARPRHGGAGPGAPDDPAVGAAADVLVLPGQGHFGQVMGAFHASGFEPVVREHIRAGRPFLGICVGLQLLAEASEEAPGVPGLGVLPGDGAALPARA